MSGITFETRVKELVADVDSEIRDYENRLDGLRCKRFTVRGWIEEAKLLAPLQVLSASINSLVREYEVKLENLRKRRSMLWEWLEELEEHAPIPFADESASDCLEPDMAMA